MFQSRESTRDRQRRDVISLVCLTVGFVCAFVGVSIANLNVAYADGQVHLRTAAYKEAATRVLQPMTDIEMDVTPNIDMTAYFLVDSISSASVSPVAGFDEIRYEGGGGANYRVGNYSLGAFGRYSYEPDYQSIFAGVRGSAELAEKNTTLGLVFGMGFDEVSNAGAQGGMGGFLRGGDMNTIMASASFGQVVSPNTVLGVTYDFMHLTGFLENPYRNVAVAGKLEWEEVPDTRNRHAIVGSVRRFVPSTRSTLIGSFRLYFDNWALSAITPEVRLVQEVKPDLEIHLRYRYHQQSAAEFFQPLYEIAGEEFRTNDPKLSAFHSHVLGAKLDVALEYLGFSGRFEKARIDILWNYVIQRNRFGNAVVLQAGLSYPFAY